MRVGITMGDPTGVGPELVAALLDSALLPDAVDVTVYGDAAAIAPFGKKPRAHRFVQAGDIGPFIAGQPNAHSGAAQIAYLEAAVEDASVHAAPDVRLDALVTAPIHKQSCLAAGFAFIGHTEFLAERLSPSLSTSAAEPLHVTMMLAGPHLRVSLVTVHEPLAKVAQLLSVPGIVRATRHTIETLRRDFRIAWPRVGIVALNPHAGENGHLGLEERDIIAPAIAQLRAEFPDAELTGPHVPDVVFRQALQGHFDALVAMYHDQGLIPLKMVDFDEAVNVTLGLPIVRTSPDHGVAHDIAGKRLVRPQSFFAAASLAISMATARHP